MPDTLDDATVHRWCGGGLASLRAHQHEIDELNVYPVPDGDTGTNLVLTLISAQQALDEPADESPGHPLGRAMRRMARGALLGARGNSGVIVSQILRGMADSFALSVAIRGGELARALRTATEAAYAAVARPVEGTVLSVVAAAAEAAGRLASDDLVLTARAAAKAAAEALARTPQQLPALARAGVVDAGGRGLVLLLEALVEALSNRTPTTPPESAGATPGSADENSAGRPAVPGRSMSGASPLTPGTGGTAAAPSSGPVAASGPAIGSAAGPVPDSAVGPALGPTSGAGGASLPPGSAEAELGFEVQYLLEASAAAVQPLRATLDGLGESLVVVGTGDGADEVWNVHVHVEAAQIGPAIEAGVAAGRPYRIAVTKLEERVHAVAPAGDRAAVVVAAGDGLTSLFAAEGATVVGRNPSTAEMLAAIAATGARHVVLLPNDANTHAVAASAAREANVAGLRVSVVPTRSPVQALAALAVRDEQRAFDEDVIAMAEAAGACRHGEVCVAGRAAFTVAGRCEPGDLLGLVDGEVLIIGADAGLLCRQLLDRMLGGGGELVTLVLGADAPPGLEADLRAHAGQAWPFVDVQCYAGGQPRYHLLVGVE